MEIDLLCTSMSLVEMMNCYMVTCANRSPWLYNPNHPAIGKLRLNFASDAGAWDRTREQKIECEVLNVALAWNDMHIHERNDCE